MKKKNLVLLKLKRTTLIAGAAFAVTLSFSGASYAAGGNTHWLESECPTLDSQPWTKPYPKEVDEKLCADFATIRGFFEQNNDFISAKDCLLREPLADQISSAAIKSAATPDAFFGELEKEVLPISTLARVIRYLEEVGVCSSK